MSTMCTECDRKRNITTAIFQKRIYTCLLTQFFTRFACLYFTSKSGQRQHTSAKENIVVWIRSPYPDTDFGSGWLPNVTGTSLSKDTCVINLSWKSGHSLRRYKLNCGKMPISRKGGWVPTFHHFFLVHRHIGGKFSWRSVQWFLRKVANRQTDKQRNKQEQSETAYVRQGEYGSVSLLRIGPD